MFHLTNSIQHPSFLCNSLGTSGKGLMTINNRRRGAIEMTLAMVISGTIGWFVVRSGRPLIELLFWRCVFGAATLTVVCGIRRHFRHGLPLRTIAWAAVGGVALVLNWLLIFASFSHASISVATVVYNTQPFMLVGLGALLFGERLTADKLAWLAVSFTGVLLIAWGQGATGHPGARYVAGILMALGAAFFYAVAALVAKRLRGTPPEFIALIQVGVGIAMLAPFAQLSTPPADAGTWGTLITLGVVYTGLVFVLLYGAIQKLPTSTVGALSFIYPLVALVVDYAVFAQRLGFFQWVGAAAILLAAAGTTLGWSRPKAGNVVRRTTPG